LPAIGPDEQVADRRTTVITAVVMEPVVTAAQRKAGWLPR
jgi:hypothetical protein